MARSNSTQAEEGLPEIPRGLSRPHLVGPGGDASPPLLGSTHILSARRDPGQHPHPPKSLCTRGAIPDESPLAGTATHDCAPAGLGSAITPPQPMGCQPPAPGRSRGPASPTAQPLLSENQRQKRTSNSLRTVLTGRSVAHSSRELCAGLPPTPSIREETTPAPWAPWTT